MRERTSVSERSFEVGAGYIPSSRMVFPSYMRNRLKYFFWRLYAPLHPFVRDGALALGIVRHSGRQEFLLGYIAPELDVRAFVAHCVERGYGNHLIAWREEGELVSLRRVCGFQYQYHLRIYEDGDVRGHYELTPECHPIRHIKGIGIEDRRHEFYEDIGDWLVGKRSSATSHEPLGRAHVAVRSEQQLA